MIYGDDDLLLLSCLQHYRFCRRQWALIHIENQWAENFRTTDGAILHENAHNSAPERAPGGSARHPGYADRFPHSGCVRGL